MPKVYSLHASAFFGMYVVVMEDLAHLRFEKSYQCLGGDPAFGAVESPEETARMLQHGRDVATLRRTAAHFHAISWCDESIAPSFQLPRDPRWFDAMFPNTLAKVVANPLLAPFPRVVAVMKQLNDPSFYERILVWSRGFGTAWPTGEEAAGKKTIVECRPKPFVVQHGDLRFDNAFFKPIDGDGSHKETCTLIDWQFPLVMHPLVEVGFFLTEAHPATLPDAAAVRTLLQVYVDGLATAPKKSAALAQARPTTDALWADMPDAVNAAVFKLVSVINVLAMVAKKGETPEFPLAGAERLERLCEMFLPDVKP